jgi:hypothetical protein
MDGESSDDQGGRLAIAAQRRIAQRGDDASGAGRAGSAIASGGERVNALARANLAPATAMH